VVVKHAPEIAVGDIVEVSGRHVGDPGRLGEIAEVVGAGEHTRYVVRWDDGHETIFYPGEATTIRPRPGPTRPRKRKHEPAGATTELIEILRGCGIEFELLPHRRTLTAAAEAQMLGALEQTVAKTVVTCDEHRVCTRAVVPASTRVDLGRLAKAIGAKRARLLSEAELVAAYPGFELGAVPPFGGPGGDRVVVDARLAECDRVVVEAGVHDASLRLRFADLVAVTGAEVEEIAEI